MTENKQMYSKQIYNSICMFLMAQLSVLIAKYGMKPLYLTSYSIWLKEYR